MNYFRTAVLLAALTALFAGVGFMIGGQFGMAIALVVAIVMNVFSYWNSDKMVLRMHGAREVDAMTGGKYYAIVRDLALKADLPMPKVYIMENNQPNAFATGRDPEHSAVAATTGLIDMLSTDELAGVMAHELAHVKNRDILIMTMTATIAGAIGMLANFAMFFGGRRDSGPGIIGTLAIMILAPMAAGLMQMAISRTREYKADSLGAKICGNPLSLASALEKISGLAREIPNPSAEENPASAHLFIINPLSGKNMDNLFSTHPNTENRIAALQELASEMGVSRPSYSGRDYARDRYARAPSTDTANPWNNSDRRSDDSSRGPWDSQKEENDEPGRGPWG